jgi:hypothetical protein
MTSAGQLREESSGLARSACEAPTRFDGEHEMRKMTSDGNEERAEPGDVDEKLSPPPHGAMRDTLLGLS